MVGLGIGALNTAAPFVTQKQGWVTANVANAGDDMNVEKLGALASNLVADTTR